MNTNMNVYKKNILVNCMVRRQGQDMFAYEMTKGLIENGCNVYAIIPEKIESLELWKKLPLKKLVIIQTYTTKKELLNNTLALIFKRNYWKIKNEFKNIRIDAVYVSMMNLWTGIINSMFPKSAKYITVHDPKPHTGANKVYTTLNRRVTKKANYIILLTDKFRQYMMDEYGFKNEQIVTIPHGNFSFYKKYTCETPYDYKGRVNFLSFGRIEKYKGYDVLADAFLRVQKTHPDTSLTVVGNGDFSSYIDKYKELPNTNVINRWIEDSEFSYFFTGKNVVLVLPYLDATQSGVAPVAWDYGCPIIASKVGGLQEQIHDMDTGLLVEPGNVDALANAMIRIASDEKLFENLRHNGSEEVKKLDWKVLSKKLADYIEKTA